MFRRIRAHALSDVDVQFVSLVRRGANRIPFRFTKKDEYPVDILRFFHKSDGQAAPAEDSPEPPARADDAMAARLDALVKSFDTLSDLVQSKLEAIDARFETVEATVRKTEASVKGAVIGIAYGDPPAAPVRGGRRGPPPLLDTGMAGFGSPS